MILKIIKYNEHPKKDGEWVLEEFPLGKINLIVGKNATGKSRTIRLLGNFAKLIAGEMKFNYSSGYYDVLYSDDDNKIEYILNYEDAKIFREELMINDEMLLKRGRGGIGKIKAVKLEEQIDFQLPENQLACVSRRDEIQHPFFEKLYTWGNTTFTCDFSADTGRTAKLSAKKEAHVLFDIKDQRFIIDIFQEGINKHKKPFEKAIIADMHTVGYNIEKAYTTVIPATPNILLPQFKDIQALEVIAVKESEIKKNILQGEMSSGMSRAFSLIIQMNYLIMEEKVKLILIDDIGEGLDYERSVALIKLIIDKVEKNNIQLVMTTNDRHVMNAVPIEYWSVLQRDGSNAQRCKIFNYINSKKIFDEFKYTGLTNFDFFKTDFYLKGLEEK